MRKLKYVLPLLLLHFFGGYAQDKVTVFFDFNQHNLNETATQQLQTWISENPNIEVSKIYGFCDWKGTNTYNDSLSIRRIKTVFNYLKENKITVKDHYEIKGFGEDFEQSKIQSENRKVLIVYDIKKEEIPVKKAIDDDALPLEEKFNIAKTGDKIKLKNLNFYNMTPRILPKSRPILTELVCALQDHPNLKIEIQGHICCQRNYDINELSVMRARAIYNYLVGQRINRKRLSYKGFGTSAPIHPIPEKSAEEEEENRRVEILILEN
jgi:outer membrane protein OmpA-like peptidoglycan-associated protein